MTVTKNTYLYSLLIALILLAATTALAEPKIEMVFVKGGCYQMGYGYMDLHRVCVDDFYIGKYEVTQEQWQNIMGKNPSYFKSCGGDCPVESVSYDNVEQFITKLNQATGKQYRLPYEAEWEYAARSRGKNELWAGTSDPGEVEEYAWFMNNSGKTTHKVGTKRPNGLGIYDMSGNVMEWCKDWEELFYYKHSPENNPKGPPTGTERVMRGDNIFSRHNEYVSSRQKLAPDIAGGDIGFRLVLPTDRAPEEQEKM